MTERNELLRGLFTGAFLYPTTQTTKLELSSAFIDSNSFFLHGSYFHSEGEKGL